MTRINGDEPAKNRDYTDARPYDSVKINLLHALIQTCKLNNIQIVFVVSPLYSGDSTARVFDLVFKQIHANNVSVLDHSCDKRFCRIRKYFADSCHLTDEGANEYSKVIASELMRLLER